MDKMKGFVPITASIVLVVLAVFVVLRGKAKHQAYQQKLANLTLATQTPELNPRPRAPANPLPHRPSQPPQRKLLASKAPVRMAAPRVVRRPSAIVSPRVVPQPQAAVRRVPAPASTDLSFEEKTLLQELVDARKRERSFLQDELGMSQAEVQTLRDHEHDVNTRLAAAASYYGKDSSNFKAYKDHLIDWHVEWMESYLGPENYSRLLQASQFTF